MCSDVIDIDIYRVSKSIGLAVESVLINNALKLIPLKHERTTKAASEINIYKRSYLVFLICGVNQRD